MWPATGWFSMPPSEEAQLLLRIVERHLRSLAFGLDEQFPAEDWGFTAQQAVEKLLKCWIVLADGEPPRSHELDLLAHEANLNLSNLLLELQPFAVEARYQIGDFKLPADLERILEEIQRLADQVRSSIATQARD